MPRIQQRQQCHDAAFAVIVGAQDQNGVFETDDQKERPEDQRDGSDNRFRRGPSGAGDRLLQPVERAGADIAIDHPERGQNRDRGQLSGLMRRREVRFEVGLKGLGHPDIPSRKI
jgi:hypothetical protein